RRAPPRRDRDGGQGRRVVEPARGYVTLAALVDGSFRRRFPASRHLPRLFWPEHDDRQGDRTARTVPLTCNGRFAALPTRADFGARTPPLLASTGCPATLAAPRGLRAVARSAAPPVLGEHPCEFHLSLPVSPSPMPSMCAARSRSRPSAIRSSAP